MPKRTRTQPRAADMKASSAGELADTLAQVDKRYGANSVRTGDQVYQRDRISTGAFILDFALLGGIPVSLGSMFVGERSAGKSTMASKVIAAAQRQYPDQTPVLLDVEGTFDPVWAGQLGVDLGGLKIVDCETGEMAVDIADAVIASKETSLVVIDSIAAMAPIRELENSIEDQHVGLQARMIGSLVRRVTSGFIRERRRGHKVTVLYLNQFRMKVGVSFGDPRIIPGGKALEFGTSVQAIIKNKETKGKDQDGIGSVERNEHSFTITKNKINAGPRTGEFDLIRVDDPENSLRAGDIDDAEIVLSYAKRFGLYTGGGSRWKLEFGDYELGFSKALEAISALREDQVLYWELRTHLIRTQAHRMGMPSEFLERIV